MEIPKNKGEYAESPEVMLENLEIQTEIAGNSSVITMTPVFKNNSEGRLTFPLPDGVSVSGYALDINRNIRNAVPVEKEKTKEVFESIERRGIDPGIIEKVQGNNFRTGNYAFLLGKSY